MKLLSLVLISFLSIQTLAEDSISESRIEKLTCNAVNFLGYSQIELKASASGSQREVSIVTNSLVQSNAKLSEVGNNPIYKFGYINLSVPEKSEVISLAFPAQTFASGKNSVKGVLFVGRVLNPFQPIYSGAPWAMVNCSIDIK